MKYATEIEAALASAESHIHAGAVWLLGAYASAETSIKTAETSDPLVQAAVGVALEKAGTTASSAEQVATDVLTLAQQIANATAPAVTAATPTPAAAPAATTTTGS